MSAKLLALNLFKDSLLNTDVIALAINVEDVNELSNYGVKKIIKVNNESLNKFSASSFADIISKVANHTNSNHLVLNSLTSSTLIAKAITSVFNNFANSHEYEASSNPFFLIFPFEDSIYVSTGIIYKTFASL